MNPFAAIQTLWTVSREVEGGWDAFQSTIAGGGSIANAMEAFAAKTDSTQLDDELAKDIEQGLTLGVEYLGNAAEFLAMAASAIEENGPAIIATFRSLSLACTKVAMQAQVLRG